MKDEQFQVHNGATGKTTPIRDLLDQEIDLHLRDAKSQLAQARAAMGQALANVVTLESVVAILAFEKDRRERSITLATPLDISRLRKQ